MKICAWNINGHNSRTIGKKFLDHDFLNTIADIDLLCLTETHIHCGTLEHLSVPGFQLLGYKNSKKNKKSNTAPGGIAIFSKDNVKNLFTILNRDNDDVVWLKLKKKELGISQDILLVTCYLSPSPEKNSSRISNLSDDVMHFSPKGHVIIHGDLNAWTGIEEDSAQIDKYDE